MSFQSDAAMETSVIDHTDAECQAGEGESDQVHELELLVGCPQFCFTDIKTSRNAELQKKCAALEKELSHAIEKSNSLDVQKHELVASLSSVADELNETKERYALENDLSKKFLFSAPFHRFEQAQ